LLSNLSIRLLTIYVTLFITLVNGSGLFLYFYFFEDFGTRYFKLGFLLLLVFLNFIIVRYTLEEFVFRKIKIIYKIIREAKLSKKEKESVDYGANNFDEIREDVIEWAQNTQAELETLKSLETYRKNFVGNISHELKTPIFTIQGYLHTLLDGGIDDPDINIDYLKRAANNTSRLQNIVEDLETISRLESGKEIIDLRKFDIKALFQEVMDDIQHLANERHIKISFKEGADHAYNVSADREAIRQVIINLLVNSIKYGKENGNTKISLYNMENQILIEITDNGIGIDEKHLKHLFDRFYRVDTSRSRSIGGSGLGLSIVKHIIEAHHQTIHVRSTRGLGSTFGFTLDKVK